MASTSSCLLVFVTECCRHRHRLLAPTAPSSPSLLSLGCVPHTEMVPHLNQPASLDNCRPPQGTWSRAVWPTFTKIKTRHESEVFSHWMIHFPTPAAGSGERTFHTYFYKIVFWRLKKRCHLSHRAPFCATTIPCFGDNFGEDFWAAIGTSCTAAGWLVRKSSPPNTHIQELLK